MHRHPAPRRRAGRRFLRRLWYVVWSVAAVVLGAAGLAVANREPLFASALLLGALTGFVSLGPARPGRDIDRTTWRVAGRRALLAGTGMLLVGAWAELLGVLVVPLVLLAVLTSPVVLGRAWPALTRISGGAEPRHARLALLHDAELCRAWRDSYRSVVGAAGPGQLASAAETRAQYLDEMERRHGPRFQAWLRTGPAPSDDPECFLLSGDD
jgi:hypothetical protein